VRPTRRPRPGNRPARPRPSAGRRERARGALARHARRLAARALLAAGLVAPAAAGEAILPEAEQAAWNAVGRVNIAGYNSRRMCTGTLVAPDRVLTAAHCVLDARDRPAPPGEIVFVAGWRAGAAAADARGAALSVHPGFSAGLATGEVRIFHDLALLTLERALVGIRPLSVAALPEGGGPLTILGYRSDRPHIATRSTPCRITHRAPDAFVIDCPVAEGTSGAPVLARTATGWRVVGVVSAASDAGTLAPIPAAWDTLAPLAGPRP
jgi:V8-like Glu-specific endopeptidase